MFVYVCVLGVGGNLVAVQASRISTSLHQLGRPGHIVSNPAYKYHGAHKTFFCGGVASLCVCQDIRYMCVCVCIEFSTSIKSVQ